MQRRETDIMSLELRTAVIKGRPEDVNRILNENGMVDVRDVVSLSNGLVVYRVNLGDIYAQDDLGDFFLTKHEEIKFLVLANNEDEYGDKVLFKDFGTTEIKQGGAFDPYFVSTYMEELEGNEIPFMDKPFEFKMESYADGEWYTVRNAMSFEEEWNDDSAHEFAQ
jgi:hypothetical protein